MSEPKTLDASQRCRALKFRRVTYVSAPDTVEWLRKQEADFRERGWDGEARFARAMREEWEERWT